MEFNTTNTGYDDIRSVKYIIREATSLLGQRICVRGYLLSYPWASEDRMHLHRQPGESDRALRLRISLGGLFDVRYESISYLVPDTGPEQYIEVDRHKSKYYFYPPSDFDSGYRRLYWKLNGWKTPGPLRKLLKYYHGSFTREAILLDSANVYEALENSGVSSWILTPYQYKNLAIVEGTLEESSLVPFRFRLTQLTRATVYGDKKTPETETRAYPLTF